MMLLVIVATSSVVSPGPERRPVPAAAAGLDGEEEDERRGRQKMERTGEDGSRAGRRRIWRNFFCSRAANRQDRASGGPTLGLGSEEEREMVEDMKEKLRGTPLR